MASALEQCVQSENLVCSLISQPHWGWKFATAVWLVLHCGLPGNPQVLTRDAPSCRWSVGISQAAPPRRQFSIWNLGGDSFYWNIFKFSISVRNWDAQIRRAVIAYKGSTSLRRLLKEDGWRDQQQVFVGILEVRALVPSHPELLWRKDTFISAYPIEIKCGIDQLLKDIRSHRTSFSFTKWVSSVSEPMGFPWYIYICSM